MLSEHFAEGVRRVRRKLPGAPVRIVNYDWHSNIANLREKGTVEGLWMILAATLPQVLKSFLSFLVLLLLVPFSLLHHFMASCRTAKLPVSCVPQTAGPMHTNELASKRPSIGRCLSICNT